MKSLITASVSARNLIGEPDATIPTSWRESCAWSCIVFLKVSNIKDDMSF